MAISRVGSASAAADTLTLPSGIQKRDLIIAFAGRENITPPTAPSGWTQIYNNAGTGSSLLGAFCYASGSGDVFGTWTNAELVMCAVYRSTDSTKIVALGSANTATQGGTTSVVLPTLSNMSTLTRGASTDEQWRVSGAHSTVLTDLASLTGGSLTTLQSPNNGASEMTLRDSDGDVTSSGFAQVLLTVSSSQTARGFTLEIHETKFPADSSGGFYNPFRNPVFGG